MRVATAGALAIGLTAGASAITATPAHAGSYTARFSSLDACLTGMRSYLDARNINVGYSCAPVQIPGTNAYWYLGAAQWKSV